MYVYNKLAVIVTLTAQTTVKLHLIRKVEQKFVSA